ASPFSPSLVTFPHARNTLFSWTPQHSLYFPPSCHPHILRLTFPLPFAARRLTGAGLAPVPNNTFRSTATHSTGRGDVQVGCQAGNALAERRRHWILSLGSRRCGMYFIIGHCFSVRTGRKKKSAGMLCIPVKSIVTPSRITASRDPLSPSSPDSSAVLSALSSLLPNSSSRVSSISS